MSKKEKKEVKVFFDSDSLSALFEEVARDVKSGYFMIGDLKVDIPGNVEAEIEYKEKDENGKTKCVVELELKWYK